MKFLLVSARLPFHKCVLPEYNSLNSGLYFCRTCAFFLALTQPSLRDLSYRRTEPRSAWPGNEFLSDHSLNLFK
jgi:hypothetical protein